jgi:hypothetical protein
MSDEKFEFGKDFQWQILRYTLTDKAGIKLTSLYEHKYFDLVTQRVIAHGILRLVKKDGRIPSEASTLNEELKSLFKTRDYAENLTDADRARVKKKVRSLYKKPTKDGKNIFNKCREFASYVEFKKVMEEIDINEFSKYQSYLNKIRKAVNLNMEIDNEDGSFMVASINNRLAERKAESTVVATPIRQLNKLTSANGFEKGSVIVLLDRPKKGKTFITINLARYFISKQGRVKIGGKRRHKKVIYFDLENGKSAIQMRLDQSIVNATKQDILDHKCDKKLRNRYRTYKHQGGEIYVKRLPSKSTTDDFQVIMDELREDFDFVPEVAIIDYVAIMGATSGAREDLGRISDAYLDVKNFAQHNGLDLVITPHHVTRKSYGRRTSKFLAEDTAKCIDIERHVDAIFGCQQTVAEEEMGLLRMEVIEMRDGVPDGRMLFKADLSTQRLIELTESEVRNYNEGYNANKKAKGNVKKIVSNGNM